MAWQEKLEQDFAKWEQVNRVDAELEEEQNTCTLVNQGR